MDPIVVAGEVTCVASAEGNEGNGNCSLFDADDVDVSFISEEGLLYYVYVGSTGAAGSASGAHVHVVQQTFFRNEGHIHIVSVEQRAVAVAFVAFRGCHTSDFASNHNWVHAVG